MALWRAYDEWPVLPETIDLLGRLEAIHVGAAAIRLALPQFVTQ